MNRLYRTASRCVLPVFILCLLLGIGQGRGRADELLPDASPLEQRASEVAKQFRADPGGYDPLFAPSFLAVVPPARLTSIFTDYFQRAGRCTGVQLVQRQNPSAGKFLFTFEKGFTVVVSLAIEADAPYKVSGLFLSELQPANDTLDKILQELKSLPGETSFLFARLDDKAITPLASYQPDKPLAIGSAFKLYVLAQLTREIESGQRHWTDAVTLSRAQASLPSGILQDWPDGSPVTLHTLATLMISVSDNTAADTLLRTLGRERVEDALAATGHAEPRLDQPFLSTGELFRIKSEPTGHIADLYEKADTATRRAMLENEIHAISRDSLLPLDKPSHIGSIEWFASPADLCRAMNWLRQHSTTGKTAPVRGILSVNHGLPIPDQWQYVGYKGGSEPGVLNMTYLLQNKDGAWYALAATWNNPQAMLDDTRFFGLVQRALQVTQGMPEKAP